MSTVKAFIFDMDGTLVDNMQYHTRAWTALLAERGVHIDSASFVKQTAGLNNPDILRQFISPDLRPEELAELSRRKERLYRELYHPHVQGLPGVEKFLQAASDRGISLGLATAAGSDNIDFILSRLGVKHLFSSIVSSEELTNGKPHPEIFLKSAAALGVPPGRCLVFEDALLGIEAARRAGMRAVLVATTLSAAQISDRSGICAVIQDFTGIEFSSFLF
jgi:beta-phosphoglucomutase